MVGKDNCKFFLMNYDMKRSFLLVFTIFGWIDVFAQSVYMHEAQEESEGTNIFDAIWGFILFLLIIWLISKISDGYSKKKELQRKLAWEKEIETKREEEKRKAEKIKKERDVFVKTLICKNTIEVADFNAVDLGLGDDFGNPLFATENLGAKNQFENGIIYGWGMNKPARMQELSYNMEPCPLKMKTLEELELISWDYGSYKGEFEYDAASKERNGLWHTPDIEEIEYLLNNCEWLYIDKYDITGWKVIGPNGNFIFIPIDKNCDRHVLLTSSASFDEEKECSTELGKTKYAQFLEINKKLESSISCRIIELDRLRVGYIRPITYGEDNWPGSIITEYE